MYYFSKISNDFFFAVVLLIEFSCVLFFIHNEYGMGLNVLFFINLLHIGCYGNLYILEKILSYLFA